MGATLQTLADVTGTPAGTPVVGLAIDHRQVAPGFIFGAFRGVRFNAEDYIPAAIAAGAVAIVARPEAPVPAGTVHIADDNPRRRMAVIAARFHAPFPATIAAVTGTNGKTSVADLLRQVWTLLGHPAASLGTLGVVTAVGRRDLGMTTPDVLTFLSTMASMQRAGIEHAVFEASSHGLDQYRVDGLAIRAAAFTNLSRDHMDYHPTVEHYRDAKGRLFAELLAGDGTAVIWADDPASAFMADLARARGITTWMVGAAGDVLRLVGREVLPDGQRLTVAWQGRPFDIRLPLIGGYQAANALVTAGLAIACGGAPQAVFGALERVAGVPGRLQQAAVTPAGAPVYVDYAHTPDGLRAAIEALRPHTVSRLHVVFGCGGDRDAGKRPEMGAIAARLADVVYVTDDNPRSEDPTTIRSAILAAAPSAHDIGDRALAIETAMRAARAGDLVLVAGKGHEQGQIVKGMVQPFDDVAVAAQIARRLRADGADA
ncbi:UDP-N-acetylmuramoyl-L-alanyl-D-glutamate--2,6-diaminopimelate ligase [Parapedomonas caeni]